MKALDEEDEISCVPECAAGLMMKGKFLVGSKTEGRKERLALSHSPK